MRWGLALGNAALHKRVDSLLRKKKGRDELKWAARVERGRHRQAAADILAGQQLERIWQVWVKVHLGGERRVDVARTYGYKDGSAITHMLKRLQEEAETKPALSGRIRRLETEFDPILAGFKI